MSWPESIEGSKYPVWYSILQPLFTWYIPVCSCVPCVPWSQFQLLEYSSLDLRLSVLQIEVSSNYWNSLVCSRDSLPQSGHASLATWPGRKETTTRPVTNQSKSHASCQWYRVPQKKGWLVKYDSIIIASILGLVGSIECTVGTKKTFPIVTRHTLVFFLRV